MTAAELIEYLSTLAPDQIIMAQSVSKLYPDPISLDDIVYDSDAQSIVILTA